MAKQISQDEVIALMMSRKNDSVTKELVHQVYEIYTLYKKFDLKLE